MEGEYELRLGQLAVGKVAVSRQGLYYRFRCRCCLTGSTIFRLWAITGDRKENLGVLVPGEGGFILDAKLPVKRFASGKPEFQLRPKQGSPGLEFIPVYPEEPFAYLVRVKDGYLVRRNGQAGIRIGKKTGL